MPNFVSKVIIASQAAAQLALAWEEPQWLIDMKAKSEAKHYSANGADHKYIHLITHTHDDVGWLKTVDEYFTGSKNEIQVANVQQLIDEVVNELSKDPTRTFSYVEMKFFSMWWDRATADQQQQVRLLVASNQLEFLNAGWSMQDEACAHADDIINNMQYGNEWLYDTLGVRPRVGWSIDPFGHSQGNPRLLADMGMDAWFFSRLDYQDKDQREADQSMNYVWRPFSQSLEQANQIFTGVMRDGYFWPTGFWCDEKFDGDDCVQSDPTLSSFNADYYSQIMYDYATDYSADYQGNQILVPMGGDFAFGNARMNYKSYDNLIGYFNDKYSDMTVLYSTPSMYLDALKAENLTWPLNTNDMFPYADQPEDYWSGYFSSRPNSKSQVRFGQANLHASMKMYAMKAIDQNVTDDQITEMMAARATMQDSMGLYNHHDAITGTSKQAVADDYTRRLTDSMGVNNAAYGSLLGDQASSLFGLTAQDTWTPCTERYGPYTNCPITEDFSGTFAVTMHNPATVSHPVQKLSVPPGSYSVTTYDSGSWVTVESNMECYYYKMNDDDQTIQTCNLFIRQPIAGGQIAAFQIEKTAEEQQPPSSSSSNDDNWVSWLWYNTQTSEDAARFSYQITDTKVYDVDFQMRYYNPATPDTEPSDDGDGCPSGAYIFKPAMDDQSSHAYSTFSSHTAIDNTFMHTDIVEYVSDDATYTAIVRTFEDSDIVDWEVQMLGIQSKLLRRQGKEVVAQWSVVGMGNFDTYYTDTNGLEMQKRILNYRPTWDLSTEESTSANYYPVNQAIVIQDTSKDIQLTVMNDRSQGGAALSEGTVELMQHRRLFYDDYRGVDEALNEKDSDGNPIQVDASYKVQLFNLTSQDSLQRSVQMQVDEPVQVFYSSNFTFGFPSANQTLVDTSDFEGNLKVHMMPEAKNQILIRIENIDDLFDRNVNSSALPTFNVKQYATDVFSAVNGVSPASVTVTERTLSNNRDWSEWLSTKYYWTTTDDSGDADYPQDSGDDMVLQPQRIRLFRVVFTSASIQ